MVDRMTCLHAFASSLELTVVRSIIHKDFQNLCIHWFVSVLHTEVDVGILYVSPREAANLWTQLT